MADINDLTPGNSSMTPEERLRITNAVESIMAKKEEKESSFAKNMQELADVRQAAKDKVKLYLEPIIEAAKMKKLNDPYYIHTEMGRLMLFEQAARLYMEQLRSLSRDDAIVLLSFSYAELTLREYV